jgi:hypothetical protein
MKIVSTEIFVLADPPPGPDEASYLNGSIAPPMTAGMGIDLPDDLIKHFRIG